ncbi:MAG: hypothetical protein R2824_17170 [Saprospiraceae bacterium]|nr:hypothetical protein [Lewinella sp.]
MNESIYLTGQIIILLLVIALFSSLMYGLRYALYKLEVEKPQRRQFRWYVTIGFIIWLVFLSMLAWLGFFRDFSSLPPRVLVAVIPPLILIGILMFSKRFGNMLRVTPMSWPIYIQAFRILMELFLWMGYNGGYVPEQMTFRWLNHDIIVGITAPMAGFVFFGRNRYRRTEAIIWNFFGIVLLFNVFMIAVLSMPTSYRVFMNEPANTFVANFPFIFIPGFIVPFALAMHLFSLRQLFLKVPVGRKFRLSKS